MVRSPGNLGWVLSVAFSPDGAALAHDTEDGTVQLWDTETWEQKRTLAGHTSDVTSVVFSPDGMTLASGSSDSEVLLWDAMTWEHKETLTVPMVAGGMMTISGIVPRPAVYGLVFSPDGGTLATAGWDETVRLWDVVTGEQKQAFTGRKERVDSVAFSPNGATLAAVTGTWRSVACAMGSQDGGAEAGVSQDAGAASSFVAQGLTVDSIAFSPDGGTLASGGWDETVRLWDVVTGEQKQAFTGHTKWVNSVAFSPDGSTLASGSGDETVRLWDTETGEQKQVLTGHTEDVYSIAFSPDGSVLASGGADGTVRLWDTVTLELKRTITGHGFVIRCVVFSPDGSVLASGGHGGTILVWKVTD